jgi:hypothetical protein
LQQHLVNDKLQLRETDRGWALAETYLRVGQVQNDAGDPTGSATAWRQALAFFDGQTSPSADQMLYRAGCHACLSELSLQPGSGVSAEEGSAESDRAMHWLRQAVTAGFANPDIYRNESALDPIRDREDFKTLMLELDARRAQK